MKGMQWYYLLGIILLVSAILVAVFMVSGLEFDPFKIIY